MASLGANFTVSSAPTLGSYEEDTEETTQPEPNPWETQIKALEGKLDQQSREASKKISELVEQNQLLNQSVQDMLQRQQPTQKPAQESKKTSGEIPRKDDGSIDWSSYWKNQDANEDGTPQGEDMNEDDIQKLVDRRMVQNQSAVQEINSRAATKEQELINRFNTEEKDLHPFSRQVVPMWKRLIAKMDPAQYQANPEAALEAVYNETMELARETFGELRQKPGPKKQQTDFNGFPGGGQSKGATTRDYPESTHASSMEEEIAAESAREKSMRDYILERKKLHQRRTGFVSPS